MITNNDIHVLASNLKITKSKDEGAKLEKLPASRVVLYDFNQKRKI